MGTRLTLKQQAFVEAYLRLQNGGKAYKEAYDKTGTMSANMAYVGAYENLRRPKILEAIKARQEAFRALSLVSTVEELAEGWTDDIRFDLGELVDEHGMFKSPKDLSSKTRRLIQGVKIRESIVEEEGGSRTVLNRWIEYKLPDRQKARIELGKRIGFYPAEKSEQTVFHTLAITPEQDAMAQKLLDEWFAMRRGNGSPG
jgi:hypothetical protein